MKVYVVMQNDSDSYSVIEGIFTKKKDAEAYQSLLDATINNYTDFDVVEVELDAARTMPGVVGFTAYVCDGDRPYVQGPIILGREGDMPSSGRYDGGTNKGKRYAHAEAATYEVAIQEATAARDAVGPPIKKRKAKK